MVRLPISFEGGAQLLEPSNIRFLPVPAYDHCLGWQELFVQSDKPWGLFIPARAISSVAKNIIDYRSFGLRVLEQTFYPFRSSKCVRERGTWTLRWVTNE